MSNKTNEIEEVVVATKDWVTALGMIAKKAQYDDVIEIQYLDPYAPTVEYLLYILRKGFGWMEEERGTKGVQNKKCLFNNRGKCSHKELTGAPCKATVRLSCEFFKIRDKTKFQANFVIIEKAGGIRGMK